MLLSEILEDRAEFTSPEEIMQATKRSKNFDQRSEDLNEAEALLIFRTSRQQTWLVVTSQRLYCILDDLRKSTPHINWSMPKSALVSVDQVILPISLRDKGKSTGYIDFGDRHRDWLYTKSLFTDVPIDSQVRHILSRQMAA